MALPSELIYILIPSNVLTGVVKIAMGLELTPTSGISALVFIKALGIYNSLLRKRDGSCKTCMNVSDPHQ